MAFQRIRIKNTNVIGKIPGADKLDTAELCINLKDHKLFSKDADGNVFELGKTAVNNGPTPPSNGNEIGDLWWDGDNLLVWNGSSWEIVGAVTSVNGEVGDVVLELGDLDDVAVDGVVDEQVLVYDANQGKWVPASAASLAVDVDLGYTPAPDKGTVTNTAGDDAELPLADATNAGLMSPADFEKLEDVTEIGDGTLTIKDPNGDALGTFTANQVDDSEITIPATKWEEIEGNPITIGGPQPNTPSPGDIWIDTGDCPPTINIWDDCDDPGNPTWKPIGGGGGGGCVQGPVQITSSNGIELNSTLTAVGGNGVDESATLTATYEWTGAKTGTGSSIVADVEGNYTVTASITCVDGSVLRNSAVWTVSDSYVDMVNNTPPVIAVVGGGVDEAYEGNSIYVVTNATVLNGEIPSIVETQWFKDGTADGTGSIYTIGAGDEGAVITAKQLFRDLRSNELLSLASNEITIVERPADAITFTAVITDDGTPTGNTPGHVLTASATNIVGGTSPIEYAYQWKSGNANTVTTKTYTLVEGDVGKIITCDVTVAEPDGSNPETRTATYAEVIEIAGTINKPTVLAPADGAGSGGSRYLISDAITEVEGEGVDRCETELIESVEDRIGYSYALYGYNDPSGDITNDSNTITDVANIPSITEATFVENVDYGSMPTSNEDKDIAFYVLDQPSSMYVTRPSGLLTSKNGSIAWSDDGVTWLGAKFDVPGGIGPDNPVGHDEPHKYWAFWTVGNDHRLSNYAPDSTSTSITLTFPDNTGFECFEQGDVVQDPDVKVISKTDEAPWEIVVDGGDWLGSDDDSVNANQLWSSGGQGILGTGPWTLAFDGDLNTRAHDPVQNGSITWVSPIELTGDVEYWSPTGSNNINSVSLNGAAGVLAAANTWTKIGTASDEIITIVSKGVNNNGPIMYAIRVDGEILIDEGLRDTKLVKETAYDTKLTVAGPKDLADMTGATFMSDGAGAPGPYTQTPYKLVTTDIESVDNTDPDAIELTFPGDVSTNPDLRYFKVGDEVQPGVEIVINGYNLDPKENKLVIDGGSWLGSDGSGEAGGDTHVEYQTTGGEGEIVSVNTDDNTIMLTNTGDRDNRWIAENKAATDFKVAGPDVVDEPLLTADVELQSSLFSTTPDDVDTLKNIVWELNGVEQNAGTSNPYKPTLSTDTTYTVRVKHQGNSLPDSAWSTSTTFTTGATRNLYTYYKERVEQLEARIAGIEADEIVDDATDVTLLTAFANLAERVEALENP